MTLAAATALLGGIGLFLLGMSMMTEGLKVAAGDALKTILDRWTRTALRGFAAGVLITAIVQSSSAVTVATVGFVNAGLMSLSQAIWVIVGTNVGTTMTGWLVALIGIKFDVAAAALPMLGLGMLLRLVAGSRPRAAGTWNALAGFGVFFLGVQTLQDGFAGLGDLMPIPDGDTTLATILLFVGLGALLTVLTQSSSAAIAITLTASAGGAVPVLLAAATVIGTNVGTTSTALFAALQATPAARRVASAHIAFNLLTGLAALLLLGPLVTLCTALAALLGNTDVPTTLAVFHTLFNLIGAALMVPLARRLVALLGRRFVTAAERFAQPQHLDANLVPVPDLALRGLVLELRRIGDRVCARAAARLAVAPQDDALTESRAHQAVLDLGQSVRRFIGRLATAAMPREVVAALPDLIRALQHLEELSDHVATLDAMPMADDQVPWAALTRATHEALAAEWGPDQQGVPPSLLDDREQAVRRAWDEVKSALLDAGSAGRLPVDVMDATVARAEALHRAADLALRAQRRLQPWLAVDATPDPSRA